MNFFEDGPNREIFIQGIDTISNFFIIGLDDEPKMTHKRTVIQDDNGNSKTN